MFKATKDCHPHSAAVTCQTPPPRPPRWQPPLVRSRGAWWCWVKWAGMITRALSRVRQRVVRKIFCDVYLIFLGKSFEWSRQILSTPPHLSTPPRRTLRCWHVDKSSCLSQPCVLIRSSTSKDWIIACCPRACRSLPCCRTAGDRQSALSLRALGGKKTESSRCSQREAGGWCVYTDISTTGKYLRSTVFVGGR